MKPKIAILAIACLLAAWIAMPSAADDTGDATRITKESAAKESASGSKPTDPPTVGVSKPHEAVDGGDTPPPSKEAAPAKTLVATGARPSRPMNRAGQGSGSRMVRDPSLSKNKGTGALRAQVSKQALGRRLASPVAGSKRSAMQTRVSASMTRSQRNAAAVARAQAQATAQAHAQAQAKAPAQGQAPTPHAAAPQPTQATTPPQPSATHSQTAHGDRQSVTAPKAFVATPPRQRQQPAPQARVIQPAPPLDEWEAYVAKSSTMYQFTEAQDDKATSILADLKHRARQYQLTRAPAFQEADRIENAADRTARLKRLNGPIDGLFDELKQRLDNLPTIPQKLQAERHPTPKK